MARPAARRQAAQEQAAHTAPPASQARPSRARTAGRCARSHRTSLPNSPRTARRKAPRTPNGQHIPPRLPQARRAGTAPTGQAAPPRQAAAPPASQARIPGKAAQPQSSAAAGALPPTLRQTPFQVRSQARCRKCRTTSIPLVPPQPFSSVWLRAAKKYAGALQCAAKCDTIFYHTNRNKE